MSSLSYDAAKLRLALMLGAKSVGDIVQWADIQIELCDNPPIELIEISMGRSLPQPNILAYLTELIADANDSNPMRAALGLLARHINDNELNAETVIPNVYELLQSENLINDYPFIMFSCLESDLALIRDGILPDGCLPKLRTDTMKLLTEISSTNENA